jgi:hypothetical protein
MKKDISQFGFRRAIKKGKGKSKNSKRVQNYYGPFLTF